MKRGVTVIYCLLLVCSLWGQQSESDIANELPKRLASELEFEPVLEATYKLVRPGEISFLMNIDKRTVTISFKGNALFRYGMRDAGTWQIPGKDRTISIDLARKKLILIHQKKAVMVSELNTENRSGRDGTIVKATLKDSSQLVLDQYGGNPCTVNLNISGQLFLIFKGENLLKDPKEGYRLKLKGNTGGFIYANLEKKSMMKTIFFLDSRGRMQGIFAYLEKLK